MGEGGGEGERAHTFGVTNHELLREIAVRACRKSVSHYQTSKGSSFC